MGSVPLRCCTRCREWRQFSEFNKNKRDPDGLHLWCKPCLHAAQRRFYQENRERLKAEMREYRQANVAAIRAADRQRYVQQRESVLKRNSDWAKRNRAQLVERKRAYAQAHPEIGLRATQRYREANREKRRAAGRRLYRETPIAKLREKAIRNSFTRRARVAVASIAPFTPEQLRAKVAYWGNACWVCIGPVEAIDHYKPVSKGGLHVLANLRPICRRCNSIKANKWPFACSLKQETNDENSGSPDAILQGCRWRAGDF